MSGDDEVERLYGLPLEEFTAARNDLAKRLKADGDADAAASVKALKKPSVVVWALNQLPRQHPDETEALLTTGVRLRGAQRKAVSGGRKDALREAQTERRRAVARLRDLAAAVLRDAGHAASPDALARIARSLEAVATDEAGAEALSRGCLTAEIEPAGFVDVGALSVVEPAEEEDDETEAEAGEDPDVVEARDAVAEARARAERASREAVRAEEAAMKRSGAVEKAEGKLEELRAAVEKAEGELADLRSGAEEAESEARAKRKEADEATKELEGAEKALRKLEG